MAYRIDYESTKKRTDGKGSGAVFALLLILAFAVLCCAVQGIGLPGWLWDGILPGDSEITKNALNCFVSDLESGAGIHQALEVFCKRVLEGVIAEG